MKNIDKLKIFYPLILGKDNSILRTSCEPITKITPEIKELWEILLELMWAYDGVGLAAPQIWETIRMIATTQRKKMPTGKSADKDFLWETLLINPEIIATDIKGKIHQQKYSGFNACIIQHEIDHLNGVLFIDKLIKEEKKKKSD